MATRMNKALREEILTNVLNATDLKERETELKQRIKDKTGQAPRGTPSRQWLEDTAREVSAA